ALSCLAPRTTWLYALSLRDALPIYDEETKVIRTDRYDSIIPPEEYAERGFLERWTNRKQKDQFVYKSRRIENVKRSRFQRKLNLAILIIFLLLVALFYAVFKL